MPTWRQLLRTAGAGAVVSVAGRRLAWRLRRWRQRVGDWWHGRQRRWDEVAPPPGALPGVHHVVVRGHANPVPIYQAGDEYERPPRRAPLVRWERSAFWAPRGMEPDDAEGWRPAPSVGAR